MSRVELAKIPALTFYKGEKTTYHRTSALPQLQCIGKPCKLYQPEAVRCVNIGGTGTDVDWKCEADLPERLRFGKVEVSCEGWSRPGDPYVLKGSCSLEYRLVEVPSALRDDGSSGPKRFSDNDWSTIIFTILWVSVLFYLAYHFVLSWLQSRSTANQTRPSSTQRPSGGGGGGSGGGSSGGGWFPGEYWSQDPPPPYTKNNGNSSGSGWRPGFWTGALAGGLANNLWNRTRTPAQPAARGYDWERPNSSYRSQESSSSSSGLFSRSRNEDRGEGSSNLGATRRSTGYGSSKVR